MSIRFALAAAGTVVSLSMLDNHPDLAWLIGVGAWTVVALWLWSDRREKLDEHRLRILWYRREIGARFGNWKRVELNYLIESKTPGVMAELNPAQETYFVPESERQRVEQLAGAASAKAMESPAFQQLTDLDHQIQFIAHHVEAAYPSEYKHPVSAEVIKELLRMVAEAQPRQHPGGLDDPV